MAARRRSSTPNAVRLAPRIVDWFLENARDLPWRHTLDPYAIWVSEIMLQQTQVKTVIPFWERWMKRLPTVEKLARAKEPTVLKLWEGLGYYRRCRNLGKAAREIIERHDGAFPNDHDAVLELTGIGRYTAGAIASIAFDQPRPILDGNVIRVLTRVHGIDGDPKSRKVNESLWSLASEYVGRCERASARPRANGMIFAGFRSALNQGLMELGATVCLPANPACNICPLMDSCVARRTDRIGELPQPSGRTATTRRDFITIVLRSGDRYLIRKRAAGVVNEGFWEFPNLEVTDKKADASMVCRKLFQLSEAPRLIDRFEHSITRYRFRQTVYLVEPADPPPTIHGDWVTKTELTKRPFFSPQIRVFKRLD